MVQLSHAYITTGKTINLTIRTFVSEVMSLFFSQFAVYVGHSFSSKQETSFNFISPSAVILESKKIKSITVPIASPSICHE